MRLAYALAASLLLATHAGAAPIIQNVSGWVVTQVTPGGCTGRRAGAEVNTSFLINDRDRVVLMTARPEWRLEPKAIKATLTIDDQPPIAVSVDSLMVMVLFEPETAAFENRLLAAKTLQWHYPWGDFTADVTGIANAVEAVRQCNKQP